MVYDGVASAPNTNAAGISDGPAVDDDNVSVGGLDTKEDSEGWNDLEDDLETLSIKCLICEQTFPAAKLMVDHCAEKHSFDFLATCNRFNLDFYGAIRLVNYVRAEVSAGNPLLAVGSAQLFEDDKYLQPAVEDDALLFCLDELLDAEPRDGAGASESVSSRRIAELEAESSRLRADFADYRSQVAETLDSRWKGETSSSELVAGASTIVPNGDEKAAKPSAGDTIDAGYFESYSFNSIHQTMLQDTVRTDAYRDFIYGNKHLFKDKLILDVGCGTGILSLFCARAGAKHVYSIDASSIIDKARAIAWSNGCGEKITFIRGKVEEISLPDGVKAVDVIVSEWMGYCLLYEAMFDSVIFTRDKWLAPSGLMVPSHASIHVAPMSDPDWMAENVYFWRDVYGFDMHTMMEGQNDEVIVRHPLKDAICGRTPDCLPLKVLDLHTATVDELNFSAAFSCDISGDFDDGLDAWCIWFDMLFSPTSRIEAKGVSVFELAKKPGAVIMSTGPFSERTHWQCGICVIDSPITDGSDTPARGESQLKNGDVVTGKLRFGKAKEKRALDVEMSWKYLRGAGKPLVEGKQMWKMR